MKVLRVLTALILLAASAQALDLSSALSQAETLELAGKFTEASSTLSNAQHSAKLTAAEHRKLEFELDRLVRIRRDYRLTKDALFVALQTSVKDVTRAEYEQWIAEGRFDTRTIDGEPRFMASSVSNLYFRYPKLEARRVKPKDSAAYEREALATCRAIKTAALAEGKPYVLPKRLRNTMTVTVNADAAPKGETIRAWLPIPRSYPFQTDFEMRSSSPRAVKIGVRTNALRAVYLEKNALAGKPTEFEIEYEYTLFGVHFALAPSDGKPADPQDPALAPFLQETTHVKFTPEMRALSAEIIGSETNDCLQAKKCFDWIADQIQYSFSLEYSTIRNLSEYCRTKRYGDCGQEALLFITLCRLNGIPARWQSGWSIEPGHHDIHDWAEIYLAPYGWMPVDPYKGIWAMRYAHTLTPAEKREVRDFYFGGLDQWRMIANSDHCQELSPAKLSPRSDTVDFQRGEFEWKNHNLYFDQFDYEMAVKEVKLPK